jgi:DNA polymerase
MDDRTLKELELLDVVKLYRGRQAPVVPRAAGARVGEAPAPARGMPVTKASPQAPAPASRATPAPVSPSALDALGWEDLRAAARDCRACELCAARKQAVFGVGSEQAPWLFVGEGPGADEDEKGEPFVGQAGKLLDAMLAAARLKRGREVYIANVVKCRPPGNRVPKPEEAAACAPFLDRQVALIAPKLIVALGKTAAVRLTGNEGALGAMRGRLHSYRGIPLVITYHPAYLIRNPPDKTKAWDDLLFAKRTMAELDRT